MATLYYCNCTLCVLTQRNSQRSTVLYCTFIFFSIFKTLLFTIFCISYIYKESIENYFFGFFSCTVPNIASNEEAVKYLFRKFEQSFLIHQRTLSKKKKFEIIICFNFFSLQSGQNCLNWFKLKHDKIKYFWFRFSFSPKN